jgi:hypothetical protein
MGIGKSSLVAFVFGAACGAMLLTDASSSWAGEHRSGIWRILRAGHFSGAMDEDAKLSPVAGSILAKGKTYRFMEFAWNESLKNAAGAEPHSQHRLLVFEQRRGNLVYLGSYVIDGDKYPQIRGMEVFFPYKDIEVLGVKVRKEISFEDGPPPSAYGGWGGSELFR